MILNGGDIIILHFDLFVENMEDMLEFYLDKLGFLLVDDITISGDLVNYISSGTRETYRLALIKSNNSATMLELLQYIPNVTFEKDLINPVTISVLTPLLEKKIEELSCKGVYPDSEIFNVNSSKLGNVNLVFYVDPEGNKVEYLEVVTKKEKE